MIILHGLLTLIRPVRHRTELRLRVSQHVEAFMIPISGEIVDAYAGKKVTLISAVPRLAINYPPKVGNNIQSWLQAHGTEVGILTPIGS